MAERYYNSERLERNVNIEYVKAQLNTFLQSYLNELQGGRGEQEAKNEFLNKFRLFSPAEQKAYLNYLGDLFHQKTPLIQNVEDDLAQLSGLVSSLNKLEAYACVRNNCGNTSEKGSYGRFERNENMNLDFRIVDGFVEIHGEDYKLDFRSPPQIQQIGENMYEVTLVFFRDSRSSMRSPEEITTKMFYDGYQLIFFGDKNQNGGFDRREAGRRFIIDYKSELRTDSRRFDERKPYNDRREYDERMDNGRRNQYYGSQSRSEVTYERGRRMTIPLDKKHLDTRSGDIDNLKLLLQFQ